MVDGRPASTVNKRTWSRYADVQSGAGDGLGFMVGGGVGCIDLDGCLDEDGRLVGEVARRVLDANPGGYVEVSMSGRGLHLFGLLDEGPGVRRPGVEVYSRARFIRVTGRTWRAGGLRPLTVPL